MRIAIAGPDGSGKTTVCNCLVEKYPNAILRYAGKNRGHFLASTSWGLKFWQHSRRYGVLCTLFSQYFVFYPLEYLENLKRFTPKVELGDVYIYDRHPLDRMIMKYELRSNYKAGNTKRIRFLVEYPMRFFWNLVYRYLFPSIDMVFVLLPDPVTCSERSGGQYKSVEDARIKIEAYKSAVGEWHKKRKCPKIIHIGKSTIVDDICTEIVFDCENVAEA